MMNTSNNITLYRTINERVRYYSISFYKNLFDEYILEKQYGSIKNKTPTGIKREFYLTLADVIDAGAKKAEEKLKKGYTKAQI